MYDFSDIRVLIVDDSADWRTALIRHLKDAGFTAIDVAHDGVHAVFKARTLLPDLILMDVGLPHMNGIEATAAIRDAALATKVVFVSAIDDPAVRLAALNAGGHDYVLKSLAGQQLINVIRHVVRDAEQE